MSADSGQLPADNRQLVAESLSLYERLDLYRAHPQWFDSVGADVDGHLKRWQLACTADTAQPADDGQPAPLEPMLDQRLRWEGFDRQSIRPVLGKVTLPEGMPPPPWIAPLPEVLAEMRTALPSIGLPARESFCDGEGEALFPEYWQGWVLVASRRLSARAPRLWHSLPAGAKQSFQTALLDELSRLGGRCLVYEFNRSRFARFSATTHFLNVVGGVTPETEVYTSFIRQLLGPERYTFLSRYPCLARIILTRMELWIDSICELLNRLDADLPLIARELGDGRPLPAVQRVDSHLSDSHNGGRRVHVVEFAGGQRIVYKPRDVAAEKAWNSLLTWLNASSDCPDLLTLKVIDRDGYGWVEYATQRGCENLAEARAYHERLGVLLGLVHLLRGHDVHCDNLIACGPSPVLVDVETLLVPVLQHDPDELAEQYKKVLGRIESSVLSTGLLPEWRLRADGSKQDLSGAGARGDDLARQEVVAWTGKNTDAMWLLSGPPETAPRIGSEPFLGDTGRLDPAEFSTQVASGFRQVYRFLAEHRQEVLDDNGPFATFRRVVTRVVPRNTELYLQVQQQAFRHKHLGSGVELGIGLDRLARPLLGDRPERHSLWPLLRCEHRALYQGDIPLFTTRAGERVLFAHHGDTSGPQQVGEWILAEDGWSAFARMMLALSEQDLAFQLQCIESSFYAKTTTHCAPSLAGELLPDQRPAVCFDASAAIAAALTIARRLATEVVIEDSGAVHRIGLDFDPEAEIFRMSLIGSSLYAGQEGIALFLAAAAATTGEESLRSSALASLQTTRAWLRHDSGSAFRACGLGGFVGVGGYIYCLAQISRLLDEPSLMDDVRLLLAGIDRKLIAADTEYDVIAGAAGCILALRVLEHEPGFGQVPEIINACARHLLASALEQEHGIAWLSSAARRPLCGMSHGNAGIALALMEAWRVTGEASFRQAAIAALAYERSLRDDERCNWPDLRAEGNDPVFVSAWCHGAPGIALARARLLVIDDLPEARQDLALALHRARHTTQPEGNLCCGMAGIDDLLLEIANLHDDADLASQVRDRIAARLHRAEQIGGWITYPEIPPHISVPGLMKGVAGIGYGLLRAGQVVSMPCLLSLSPE